MKDQSLTQGLRVYGPLLALGACLILFFENCGVQQPKVESGSIGLSSMSPSSHQSLPDTVQCSVCHEASRPLNRTQSHNFNHSDPSWAGQDCVSCHNQRATWGLTWTGGQFSHEPHPAACLECHTGQMPRTTLYVANDAARPFQHTVGAECVTCHSSTSQFNTLSDWRPALAQPSGLAGTRSFSTNVISATFNGSIMSRSTPTPTSLRLEISHGHDQVGNLACATCHGGGASSGQFAGAYFHRNIALNPSTCAECHVNARPTGAVGSRGFMRHEAVAWISNAIGSVSRGTASMVAAECSMCHLNTSSMPLAGVPTPTGNRPFTGASFHQNISPASLSSCLDCHAHNRPSGSAQFTDITWRNRTNVGAPPSTTFDLVRHAPNVDCATCHTAPSTASSSAASWAPGNFAHSSATVNCLNCHTSEGVTSVNHSGFNSNCVTCHTGATLRFPSPVIGDWRVGVTAGTPTGVVGTKTLPGAMNCTAVLGRVPNCTPSNPNIIAKGYDHAVNSNGASCLNCHGAGVPSTANGKFHTPPTGASNWIAPSAADIASCSRCHDPTTQPLTAVSIRTVGTVGSSLSVSTGSTPFAGVHHGNLLIAGVQCSQCHTAPTAAAATTWNQATRIHSRFSAAQLTTCSECHSRRMPASSLARRNQQTYRGTHRPQNFTHTSTVSLPTVPLQQCSNCHSAATPSWTALGQVSFHNRVTTTQNCNLCHVAPGGLVTSATTGVSFNHDQVANIGDCATCHQSSLPRVAGRIPAASDWDGGRAAPTTYTIPSHTSSGVTVPGFTGTHSANPNCASCHGTGNYRQITDFDHQGLPAGQNSCVSCHLGAKADVSAFIATTSPITMKTMGDRHHPVSIFNGRSTSCVGCHTLSRGTNTFTNSNGINFPTAARQAYISVGCGSVNGTTFSCHESNQRIMTVPTSTGTSGVWK